MNKSNKAQVDDEDILLLTERIDFMRDDPMSFGSSRLATTIFPGLVKAGYIRKQLGVYMFELALQTGVLKRVSRERR